MLCDLFVLVCFFFLLFPHLLSSTTRFNGRTSGIKHYLEHLQLCYTKQKYAPSFEEKRIASVSYSVQCTTWAACTLHNLSIMRSCSGDWGPFDSVLVRTLWCRPPGHGFESNSDLCFERCFCREWPLIHVSQAWPAPRPNKQINQLAIVYFEILPLDSVLWIVVSSVIEILVLFCPIQFVHEMACWIYSYERILDDTDVFIDRQFLNANLLFRHVVSNCTVYSLCPHWKEGHILLNRWSAFFSVMPFSPEVEDWKYTFR